MHVRRQARQVALEVLYEVDCAEHSVDDVITRRLVDNDDLLDQSTENFLREIIHGVIQHQAALDIVIHEYAPEWPVDQMAIIDRNILRMAIFEIAIDEDTPVKVAINEAVELAKIYGSDSAPRFVNGVLGTLASNRQSSLITTLVQRNGD